jgi:tetratricopeptide (TPR) repeat protein
MRQFLISFGLLGLIYAGWFYGIRDLNSQIDYLTQSIVAILLMLLLIIILLLFSSIFIKVQETAILPFESATGSANYDGKSVSDFLLSELERIGKVHNIRLEGKQSNRLNIPPQTTSGEELRSIFDQFHFESQALVKIMGNIGTIDLGKLTLPIGSIILAFKRLSPWGKNVIISGSIQKYGKLIVLVAHIEHEGKHGKICTCEAIGKPTSEQDITYLIKDLAYKIAFDISRDEIEKSDEKHLKARTWDSFKHFTEALENYYSYTITEKRDDLDRANENCHKATKSEPGYSILFGLFYNLGIAYYEIEDYDRAIENFKNAILIQNHAGAFSGLGAALRYRFRFKEAYLASLDALKIDSELAIPETIIGNTYLDLGCYAFGLYNDAITWFNKAENKNPNFPYPIFGTGIAYYKQRDFKNAIEFFIKADKLIVGEKYGVIHLANRIALASSYKQIGDKESYEKIIQEIRWRIPNESIYNRAAFEAIRGDAYESLSLLDEALKRGFATVSDVIYDPDFDSVRDNVKFQNLMKKYKEDIELKKEIREYISDKNEYIRASFEATIENFDEAIRILQEAAASGKLKIYAKEIKNDPHFKNFSTDPRFQKITKDIEKTK